ncbi:MAG: YebC/PmpR family DNA-binding transcriptional regulator, partial [Deinococcus sp.]|nr:YebC/PmpR family DNA-binding transcriptional regulator [Deinococcus sp.]
FEEVTYEGYGPGGVAIMVVVLTDNRNRTAGEVRRVFDRSGGSLGAAGSVAWQFHRKGLIVLEGTSDQIIEAAIECGAEDFDASGGVTEVYVEPAQFFQVKEALEKRGIAPQSAELTMLPQNTVRLPEDKVQQVMRLLENLEDLDDIQNVYSNVDLSGVST